MKQIEQTITSIEVAEMVEKVHSELLKDIRRYIKQFTAGNIPFSDFFQESTYKDSTGRTLPCYKITKKGCEFIAHKLTGTKGTIFTARYINRFHEMKDIISQQKEELPWFIKVVGGRYVVLERDFIEITGVNVKKHKKFYRAEYFTGGLDWNAWGWKCDNEKFKTEHGFDYGEENTLFYFYLGGVRTAIRVLQEDPKIKLDSNKVKMLLDGVDAAYRSTKELPDVPRKGHETMYIEKAPKQNQLPFNNTIEKGLPIKINIVVQGNTVEQKDILLNV